MKKERIKNQTYNIGLLGLGAMGRGLLYQFQKTPHVHCPVICDLNIDGCFQTLREFNLQGRLVSSENEMMDTIRKGIIAVCEDGGLLPGCSGIDVLVEASSSVGEGAMWALEAIRAGQHVALMNSEIDLAFGPLLHREAQKQNVICTTCDGDQPGVIKHLADEAASWGFELVMAGNIKGFLDPYATPDSIAAEAAKRRLNPRMCCSFTDGTKLNIEMALVANHLGMKTAVPGMLGPKARHIDEVLSLFDFTKLKQEHGPVVDYILGAEPGGGVFVVGSCDHPYQRSMLEYYKMGPGPYYLFYRPYHLCHIEAAAALLKTLRQLSPLMPPLYHPPTQVCAMAKKDLTAGEKLDGIGGFAAYGRIENRVTPCPENSLTAMAGLPIFLTENARVLRDVKKDHPIFLEDVRFADDDPAVRLYRETAAVLQTGENGA